MKIHSITPYKFYSQNNNRNHQISFTSLYSLQSAATLSKDVLKDLSNSSNPLNKAFLERLTENFSSSKEIARIYKACLNSNKIISKKAEDIFNKICFDHSDEKSRVYKDNGLSGVSIVFESAKDFAGNHNDKNLDFVLWLDKNYEQPKLLFAYDKITDVIHACQNDKGICSEGSIFTVKLMLKNGEDFYFEKNAREIRKRIESHPKTYIGDKHKIAQSSLDEIIKEHGLNCYTAEGMLKLLQEMKNNNTFLTGNEQQKKSLKRKIRKDFYKVKKELGLTNYVFDDLRFCQKCVD